MLSFVQVFMLTLAFFCAVGAFGVYAAVSSRKADHRGRASELGRSKQIKDYGVDENIPEGYFANVEDHNDKDRSQWSGYAYKGKEHQERQAKETDPDVKTARRAGSNL